VDLLKSKIFPLVYKIRKKLNNFFSWLKNLVFKRQKNLNTFSSLDDDKKLIYSLSHSKVPSFAQLKYLGKVLNKKEKLIMIIFSLIFILSLGFLGVNFYNKHLLPVAAFGGEYTEALIGEPSRINPLYSSANDPDADISKLVYSSLFKLSKNGQLVKDLVADYQVSEDGKTYTIKLLEDAKWQNGGKITADDVVFTFGAIKNSAYNSPLRSSFNGVDVQVGENDQTVIFSLQEKYAPFLNLLTFGILPSDLWGQVNPSAASLAELNLKPIGSGPYIFKSLTKDKDGNIKSYELTANKDYYGGEANIKNITFKFYASFPEAISALNANEVDSLSYLPQNEKDKLVAKGSLNFYNLNLPQIKAVFLNSDKNPILKDVKVRQALAYASPRNEIINNVLKNAVRPAYGPITTDNIAYDDSIEKYNLDLNKASSLLADSGWKKETITDEDINALQAGAEKNTLSAEEKDKLAMGAGDWLVKDVVANKKTKKTYFNLSLTALSDDENSKVAEALKNSWEKIGVKVNLNLVDASQVQASVIKTRQYEALLFSEFLGADPDVYVFWHSSQAGTGGLNLSNYKSEEADKDLEDGRLTLDANQRLEDYKKFQKVVTNDAGAIFLYSPFYTYVGGKKIKNISLGNIAYPADRFSDINQWYIKSNRKFVW